MDNKELYKKIENYISDLKKNNMSNCLVVNEIEQIFILLKMLSYNNSTWILK